MPSRAPNSAAVLIPDETSALLGPPLTELASNDPGDVGASSGESVPPPLSSAKVLGIVSVLVAGAFMANIDASLVLATHPTIASEFNSLSWSSWLFVAFNLAGAATQAIYGKLSDTYGRRPVLVAAYTLFALGCAMIGAGRTMAQVVLGRMISGCGAAALNVLALLIVTDLVPLREAASWQSGINLAAVTGRSLGAPAGGWLTDLIGWRWSFMGQVPIFAAAVVFCMARIPANLPHHAPDDAAAGKDAVPRPSGIARIDFLGAALLALTVVCLLLPIEIVGTKEIPWTHSLVLGLAVASLLFGVLFFVVEEWLAAEPVFPTDLLRHRDVLLLYLVSGTQAAAQFGLTFAVPLYFQVTQRSSNAASGASLVPAFIGNAAGAILGGLIIKRTGRYKHALILATALASSAYLVLFLRWHGHTHPLEALEILPGGMGTGMVQSVVFVAVAASIDPSHKAAAMSGMFLVSTVGSTLGLAAVNAVTLNIMKLRLDSLLTALGYADALREQIIEKAAASVDYLDVADKEVVTAVVHSYVEGLSASHVVSLVCSLSALMGCILIRERQLH